MAAVVFTVDAEYGHRAAAGIQRRESPRPARRTPTCSSRSPASTRGGAGPPSGRPARWSREHGVRGFKFHPSLQAFHPNDPMAYPLYEVLQELGVVALFHSGQTGIGAGVRGGGGIRLKYANPLALDDVAADFPDLKIIIAHPSFPWQDEALAVATHKPLVHIDLSGWSPKYFPPQLVRYANTLLQGQGAVRLRLPLITPDRWLADFAALDIKPEVRPLILQRQRGPPAGPDRCVTPVSAPGPPAGPACHRTG